MTRAPDGMRLDALAGFPYREWGALPSEGVLVEAVRRLARELDEGRQAPVQAPMAAPVILDPEVTSVLFHEALGHKLEGQRQRDPAHSQIFKDLVGKRVIRTHELHRRPDVAVFQGTPVSGHYLFEEAFRPSG